LSPFWALLSVSLIQKSFWEVPELYEKELTRYRDVFVEVSEKKKKKKKKNIHIRAVHKKFFQKSTGAYRVGFDPHCCILLPLVFSNIGSTPPGCDAEPSFLL
jgi:hypothetical protein